MLLALSAFKMNLYSLQYRQGRPKIPYGLVKDAMYREVESLEDSTKKEKLLQNLRRLFDNVPNWAQGKNRPRKSTLEAMRKGEYGEAGKFIVHCQDAWDNKDSKEFYDCLYDVVEKTYGDAINVDLFRSIDDAILCFISGKEGCDISTLPLPDILKQEILNFKNSKMTNEGVGLFYLYFIVSCRMVDCFMKIIEQDQKTLFGSFIACIRDGIKERRHKMRKIWDRKIWDRMKMDEGEFNKRLKSPARFLATDFIKRFAESYYDIVFPKEIKNAISKEDHLAVLKCLGFAVHMMDSAKKKDGIDFRALAEKHGKAFVDAAKKMSA